MTLGSYPQRVLYSLFLIAKIDTPVCSYSLDLKIFVSLRLRFACKIFSNYLAYTTLKVYLCLALRNSERTH